MNAWIAVFAVGFGSYALRLSMIGAVDWMRLPSRLDESVALAAPSAFASFAFTGIAGAAFDAGLPQAVAPLTAAAVAAFAVARSGSPYAAMLAGMPTFWILTAVAPT